MVVEALLSQALPAHGIEDLQKPDFFKAVSWMEMAISAQ